MTRTAADILCALISLLDMGDASLSAVTLIEWRRGVLFHYDGECILCALLDKIVPEFTSSGISNIFVAELFLTLSNLS